MMTIVPNASLICIVGYAVLSTMVRMLTGDDTLAGTFLQFLGAGVVGNHCGTIDRKDKTT